MRSLEQPLPREPPFREVGAIAVDTTMGSQVELVNAMSAHVTHEPHDSFSLRDDLESPWKITVAKFARANAVVVGVGYAVVGVVGVEGDERDVRAVDAVDVEVGCAVVDGVEVGHAVVEDAVCRSIRTPRVSTCAHAKASICMGHGLQSVWHRFALLKVCGAER